jgi:exodeoxyribonuclease VII large subunit
MAIIAMEGGMMRYLARMRERLELRSARLRHPGDRLQEFRRRVEGLEVRNRVAGQRAIQGRQLRLQAAERSLQALSPLGVLNRGYAIVQGPHGVVRHASEVRPGDTLSVRVRTGTFNVTVAPEG